MSCFSGALEIFFSGKDGSTPRPPEKIGPYAYADLLTKLMITCLVLEVSVTDNNGGASYRQGRAYALPFSLSFRPYLRHCHSTPGSQKSETKIMQIARIIKDRVCSYRIELSAIYTGYYS